MDLTSRIFRGSVWAAGRDVISQGIPFMFSGHLQHELDKVQRNHEEMSSAVLNKGAEKASFKEVVVQNSISGGSCLSALLILLTNYEKIWEKPSYWSRSAGLN